MTNKERVVKKAVITAAGLGTRFLPQTKAMPKEMLPLIDKPIIQYIVEDLVKAGVEQIIMVTGAHKRSVEDHFDRAYGLENTLRETGKDVIANELKDIAELANFVYIRQKGMYGTATPVSNAREMLGKDPFYVVFPDDFFVNDEKNEFEQLLEVYRQKDAPVISAVRVPQEEVSAYGVFKLQDPKKAISKIKGVVEKPETKDAPSNVISAGTFILKADIWPHIDKKIISDSGEHLLSLALDDYAKHKSIYTAVIEGRYHDTGSKQTYLQAVLDLALRDEELGPELADYVMKLIEEMGYNKTK